MGLSLRAEARLWIGLAMLAGLGLAGLWQQSRLDWQAHLARAEVAGTALQQLLTRGGNPPAGMRVQRLAAEDAALAEAGAFARMPGLPGPVYVTHVPLRADPPGAAALSPWQGGTAVGTLGGLDLRLVIVSRELAYPLAALRFVPGATMAERVGEVSRLMAGYCSTPVLFARSTELGWMRIDAPGLWSCRDLPPDLRLPAVLGAAGVLMIIFMRVAQTGAGFAGLAQMLRERRRSGSLEAHPLEGPAELRELVAAINTHLDSERERLANRALVLSGVSHDLGTPATRLRLRTALIEDATLRGRIEADIDAMTGMIESVLTYTRAEQSAEPAVVLSLSALVEAVVADYQDTGQPVELVEAPRPVAAGVGSVFASARGHARKVEDRRMLVEARPVALSRALTNLVDNALKYGRLARVSVSTTAGQAEIRVEDEGGAQPPEMIAALVAPWSRGAGTEAVHGQGLGLTIVATVAAQHGGGLRFEPGARGLRAILTIARR